MGEYKQALRKFSTLLSEQKAAAERARGVNRELQQDKKVARKFVGRDRRLYFNKALCEM